MSRSRAVAGALALALAAFAAFGGIRLAGEGDDGSASGQEASGDGDRLIFWTNCQSVAELSDAELDEWKSMGVDGFVCMTGLLAGLGGDQSFSAEPGKSPDGEAFELMRSLEESDIAGRAEARDIKLYLGAYFSNYRNAATPLAEWFDEPAWQEQVLPRLEDLAGAARKLGFAGVAFDGELYPQTGGAETATWDWDYPGNTHSESEVRAAATARGEQVMERVLDGFPEVEIAVYHFAFPGDWKELVRREASGQADTSARTVHVDFWDGMTRVEGYEAVRFYESFLYKTPHLGTWDTAMTHNTNQVLATFSREFANWPYASERVYLSPFSWINPGPSEESSFDDSRPAAYVEEQLLAFRRWSMGNEFANYVYGGLEQADYTPYEAAMQEASGATDEDDDPPQIAAHPARADTLGGTAQDDLAIRVVRWSDDEGGAGTAELRWKVTSGNFQTGYEWHTTWTIPRADLAQDASTVEIEAEDIKGQRSAPATVDLR